METVEGLKRQINTTEDLHSVVRTMKALSAVSIRQYEEAVQSLEQYSQTIEMGFQILLQNFSPQVSRGPGKEGLLGLIIFGSDQGMCGQFNDVIVSFTREQIHRLTSDPETISVWAVGQRLLGPLQEKRYTPAMTYELPGSVEAITGKVQELFLELERKWTEKDLKEIFLFYNHTTRGASYSQKYIKLWPVDLEWFANLKEKKWPGRTIPTATMDWQDLLSSLTRQYLFISIYRALAESLAAENAARLMTMEAAQKNIEERQGELEGRYHRLRQGAITDELLDIIGGFVALEEEEN